MDPKYYFLFMALSYLFYIILYGLNHNESFEVTRIAREDFSKHYLIHRVFISIGIFIISICLHKYEVISSRSELIEESNYKEKTSTKNELIYNDAENMDKSIKFILFYLFIILCWVLLDDIIENYIVIFKDLDFWMFELIILWYLSIKMFKYEIYNHQILGISLCLFSGLLKIGCIIVTFINVNGDDNDKDKGQYNGKLPIIYKVNKNLIFVGIILYILLITLRSYVYLKLKWYMDKKYVSHNKIFIVYGFLGIIIYCIISLIGTKIKCNSQYIFSQYICKVITNNNGSNVSYNLDNRVKDNNITYYLENIFVYFDNYKKNYNFFEKYIWEIIVILLGIISWFLKEYFTILIIKYLTPVHVIISIPIVFLAQKAVMIIRTFLGNTDFFKKNTNKKIKFSLDIFGDAFCVLGFIIYLELIQIKCCKFDYNTRYNMIKRSFGEINEAINDIDQYIILDENNIQEIIN